MLHELWLLPLRILYLLTTDMVESFVHITTVSERLNLNETATSRSSTDDIDTSQVH